MDSDIILITCVIILVIDALYAIRNQWVYNRRMELNRFENGVHLIKYYLDYHEMMDHWWIWDVEKLKLKKYS